LKETLTLPRAIKISFCKSNLKWADKLKEKFKRNGEEVDAEVRRALVERMREGSELEEDQKKVFGELEKLFGGEEEGGKTKSLKKTSWKSRATFGATLKGRMGFEKLFGGEEEGGWRPLESPYEGVKMEIKYKQQEKGKKTLGFGRAECLADCSAEEAAAWFFEYCSRERMALSREEGNPARLEIRKWGEERVNEKLFATVKKLPYPLHKREFVMRYVLQKGRQNDTMSVAFVPAKEQVDYGGNL
jgi:hypothetical protein